MDNPFYQLGSMVQKLKDKPIYVNTILLRRDSSFPSMYFISKSRETMACHSMDEHQGYIVPMMNTTCSLVRNSVRLSLVDI